MEGECGKGETEAAEEERVDDVREGGVERDCGMEAVEDEDAGSMQTEEENAGSEHAVENRPISQEVHDARVLADDSMNLESSVDRAFSADVMTYRDGQQGQIVGMEEYASDKDAANHDEEQIVWQNEAVPRSFHVGSHREANGVYSVVGKNEEDDDDFEGAVEEQLAFSRELDAFFQERNLEFKPPKFYGEELNCLKLWRAVVRLGGYDQVTSRKLWRHVGEFFKPPKKCTTVSWSFRGFYKKALLDYERWKMGTSISSSYQGQTYMVATCKEPENQETYSHSSLSQPCAGMVSALGRARRDAAAKAMQGWHSQRIGNGEVGEPIIKDKSTAKRRKRLKNAGALKSSSFEAALKGARAKGARTFGHEENFDDAGNYDIIASISRKKVSRPELMKQVMKIKHEFQNGIDPLIVDEGPEADWVKINIHQMRDCFEVYALVPGLLREEVRIQCEAGGRLVIAGEPEQPENPWGVTAFRKVISLPMRIDAHQTSAVVTLHGQLFIRVPFAQPE